MNPTALYDLAAPAKINLFLHLLGRRPDGYHLLQSVFALLDWQDTLHLELRSNGQISREDLTVVLPADDLCTRAAYALQKATGCHLGAHIAIAKSIPAEAGMGGGSSDAATCLIGLNRLWQTGLHQDQLCTIGLQLGADVPFFIRGKNAWVEGIGEHITPIEIPEAEFLVIKPHKGLSTKDIFTAKDLKRDTKPATIAVFAEQRDDLFNYGQNDMQAVAQRLCPEITDVIHLMSQMGLKGRMTGSGSAVFAWLPLPSVKFLKLHEQQLKNISQQFKICKILSQHPLYNT
jgi:4-diphosphocytidyl-2-C-methyl-D-erythritol kinase